MPIYAYRCESCGFEKDVLRKLSDAPLTQCPECGKDTFSKQVTAAGFQLKGSGWYVTDFRGGNNGGSGKSASTDTPAKSDSASNGADSSASSSSATSAGSADSSSNSSNTSSNTGGTSAASSGAA
ncbi:FmdB family zinc ribbon protein [Caballeronia sp. BR00000012568055]|uniref:FmdB family zinc ribbon protein n=1 Tax=Caballeronia sp. BR00000012568055 TaxID=2918761 RepID=UPI0023FA099E|nr:FmdB family zinc ribbon protein [Caballeronia sp. BR00000012568055]